jgi:protein phosphatase
MVARQGTVAHSPFTFARHSVPGETHDGRNEDRVLAEARSGLAAVFDGVGGSAEGEIAAQTAARVIRRGWRRILAESQQGNATPALLEQDPALDLCEALQRLVEEAHAAIRADIARQASHDPGQPERPHTQETTVALAVLSRRSGVVGYLMGYAHAGDSRVYLLREGAALQRLTQDDGLLSKLVLAGEIDEAVAWCIDQATRADLLTDVELALFYRRNGITQALGDPNPPEVHTGQVVIGPGDRILVCTDGIHDNLTDLEIEEVLRGGARTTVARALVNCALDRAREDGAPLRAKPDDMSAVVITCNR